MRVLVVTGEASGDVHAAKVVRHLHDAGAQVAAVGGPALAATGARILERVEALTVVGLLEVAGRIPRLLALKRRIDAALRAREYDLVLLVDYAGFNLRLAASAQRAGIPVLYFVGPQVWAWRAHRLGAMRRNVDHVALILPFEKPHYDAAGVPATFVGHPLLDDPAAMEVEADRDLGLFPGSRPQEIAQHLPLLLAAAARRQSPHGSVILAFWHKIGRASCRERVCLQV
jgi:lipid-A-disaccharide synthase